MRAVAVDAFRAVPYARELPEPHPNDGELRVRVGAAGINPFDWKIADGVLDGHRPHRFPLVMGIDAAGTVDEVGPGARSFGVGDRIFGQFLHDPVGQGTYAEYTVVPETNGILRIPASLTVDEAAAAPTAGMTAVDAIGALDLPAGGTLLVVGASGGVGSFAVPMARAGGWHVTAVARPASRDRLLALGASETIDVAADDAVDQVRRLHPNGVDGLLDMASDRGRFRRWTDAVRGGGAAVSTVYAAETQSRVRTVNLELRPRAELLQHLVTALASGSVRVPVERTIRLDEAPGVVAEGRAGRFSGKTVIRFDA